MGSAFDAEFASEVVPDLLDEFGETITHYPNGGAGVSVTAIVTWDTPVMDESTGKAQSNTGSCSVNDSVAITEKDSFDLQGQNYQVTWVRPSRHGMVDFGFMSMEHIRRTRGIGGR